MNMNTGQQTQENCG